MFFPQFKGSLNWAHAVIKGWAIADPVRHTVPMVFALACLFAVFIPFVKKKHHCSDNSLAESLAGARAVPIFARSP